MRERSSRKSHLRSKSDSQSVARQAQRQTSLDRRLATAGINRQEQDVQPLQERPLSPTRTEGTVIHPQLEISQPQDRDEQEAEAMGRQVVQSLHTAPQSGQRSADVEAADWEKTDFATAPIQRVQRQADEGGTTASPEVEEAINAKIGTGHPLPADIRGKMESAFGEDFSAVQVHTDSEAQALNESVSAKAFTTGQDIFFNEGTFDPGSMAGQELLAHELTHVVQQTS
ncbi:MAG: DUF4157 domain-containing protein [Kamptonema sp. SIO4C4]|nr:DUF4157 domain-containing protein [Kamptonema sp. SIO4C4]